MALVLICWMLLVAAVGFGVVVIVKWIWKWIRP